MTKKHSYRLFSVLMALVLCFSTFSCVTVFAASPDEEVSPCIHVDTSSKRIFYPNSGSSSGTFTGKTSHTLTYSNVDAGLQLTIYYMFEGGSNAKLIFQNGGLTGKVNLTNDGNFHSGHITLPNSGPWNVYVEVDDDNYSTTRYFAFDIYRLF